MKGNKVPPSSPHVLHFFAFELLHDKTNKIACAPSEDSDQPGCHLPSLISIFAGYSMGSLRPKLSSCGQRRLWSDWANAQSDLSLHWAHRSFCWFRRAAAHLVDVCRIFYAAVISSRELNNRIVYNDAFCGWIMQWERGWFEPRHEKTNKMTVRPAKTQISLGIRPVWSESSLSTWRKLGSLATH